MKMFTLDEIEAMPIADGDKIKIAYKFGVRMGRISSFMEVIRDVEGKQKEANDDLLSRELA